MSGAIHTCGSYASIDSLPCSWWHLTDEKMEATVGGWGPSTYTSGSAPGACVPYSALLPLLLSLGPNGCQSLRCMYGCLWWVSIYKNAISSTEECVQCLLTLQHSFCPVLFSLLSVPASDCLWTSHLLKDSQLLTSVHSRFVMHAFRVWVPPSQLSQPAQMLM